MRLANMQVVASRLSKHTQLSALVATSCLIPWADVYMVKRLLPPTCELHC